MRVLAVLAVLAAAIAVPPNTGAQQPDLTTPTPAPAPLPTLPGFGPQPGMMQPQQQATEDLPEGEGRDYVEAICVGCHSLKTVTQQKLSRDRWDALLVWMVEKQGMAELDPETRDIVLNYLGTYISPDAPPPPPPG